MMNFYQQCANCAVISVGFFAIIHSKNQLKFKFKYPNLLTINFLCCNSCFIQQFTLWDFRLRRSCKISVIPNIRSRFSLRCNRKTACFAVTPQGTLVKRSNITKIWQLRRRENPKAEIAKKNACRNHK